MVSTKKGNTSLNIETKIKNDLTNQITRIKIEARIKKKITKANIGIKTKTGINIVPVPSRIKRSMTAVARIRTRRAPRPAKIRNIRAVAVVPPARIRTRTKTRNIITSQARALKTKIGKKKRKRLGNLYTDVRISFLYSSNMQSILLGIIAAPRIRIVLARTRIAQAKTRTVQKVKTKIDIDTVL